MRSGTARSPAYPTSDQPGEMTELRRNRLRELLDADQATLGTHLISSWPSVVELVGLSGMFDYVEFVAEYGPGVCQPRPAGGGSAPGC